MIINLSTNLQTFQEYYSKVTLIGLLHERNRIQIPLTQLIIYQKINKKLKYVLQ